MRLSWNPILKPLPPLWRILWIPNGPQALKVQIQDPFLSPYMIHHSIPAPRSLNVTDSSTSPTSREGSHGASHRRGFRIFSCLIFLILKCWFTFSLQLPNLPHLLFSFSLSFSDTPPLHSLDVQIHFLLFCRAVLACSCSSLWVHASNLAGYLPGKKTST